jgi:RNA polymerase sigma-54 factor
MKPSLQLRLSQQLALTPQLQQSIRLLQLSTLELNQEIERMLLDNPMLERDDEDAPGPGEGAVAADGVATADEARTAESGNGDGNTADTDIAPSEQPITASSDDDFEVPEADMPDTITEAYDSVSDDDIGEAAEWRTEAGSKSNSDDDETDFQEFQAAETSLNDHLTSQIALMPFSDRDRALVRLVIESLDEDG